MFVVLCSILSVLSVAVSNALLRVYPGIDEVEVNYYHGIIALNIQIRVEVLKIGFDYSVVGVVIVIVVIFTSSPN